MIKRAFFIVFMSLLSIVSITQAKQTQQVEASFSLQGIKPSVLQKEFGLTPDMAMRVVAYQAEYGEIRSDFKNFKTDKTYIDAKTFEKLRPKFNKKFVYNFCKRYPAVCKGFKTQTLATKSLQNLADKGGDCINTTFI